MSANTEHGRALAALGTDYANATTRIYQQQGEAAARAAELQGQIWGQAFHHIGQDVKQGVQHYQSGREDDQIKKVLAQYGGDITKALPDIAKINPDKAHKIGKQFYEQTAWGYELQDHQWKADGRTLQTLREKLAGVTDQAGWTMYLAAAKQAGQNVEKYPPVFDPQTKAQIEQGLEKAWQMHQGAVPAKPEPFTLGEGQKRFAPDGTEIAAVPKSAPVPSDYTLGSERRSGATNEVIATAPPPPPAAASGFSLAPGGTRYDAQGNVIAHQPDRPPGPSAEDKVLVPIVGPDGKPVLVPRGEAVGKTPASAAQGAKPPTGAQNKVLGFFNRAKQADDDLQDLEARIAKKGYFWQAWMNKAPNVLQSSDGQRYTQAQRAFTEARLRKDSGAAIPEQEFENDRQTYFVQPGDDAKTIAQKARARAAVLASLAFESGGALEGFYGDEAGSMIEGFRTRSAKGGKPPAAAGAVAPPPAPPGWKYVPKPGGGWTAVEVK